MFSKKLKTLYMVLSILFTVLFITVTVATPIMYKYDTVINIFLNVKTAEEVGGGGEYYKSDYSTAAEKTAAAVQLCYDVESEGAVLLKNTNKTLPLASGSKISALGVCSVATFYCGSGSGAGANSGTRTLKTALDAAGFVSNPTFWNFYTDGAGKKYRPVSGTSSMNNVIQDNSKFKINEAPLSAYSDAEWSSVSAYGDAAIVVFGRGCGEGGDIPWFSAGDGTDGNALALTKEETDLLGKVKQLKDSGAVKKIIVLLNSSNAFELDFLDKNLCGKDYGIDACMWIGYTGESGINAVADILCGKVNPSGKLPMTFCYDNLTSPAMQNTYITSYANADEKGLTYSDLYNKYYEVYAEGIYVGYRYYETRYEDYVLNNAKVGAFDYASTVAYPFGYGISYSDFSFENFKLENETDTTFEFSVTVRNNSSVAGKEVAAVYMQSPYTEYDKANGIEKSSVQLAGYTKVEVPANGVKENVKITVDKEEMRAYDANGAGTYIKDAGNYYFALGNGSHDALNNVLAKKSAVGDTTNGTVDESRIIGEKDASLCIQYQVGGEVDKTTYKTAKTGNEIVNRFDNADLNRRDSDKSNDVKYLTRSDWAGTMPKAEMTATSYKAAFTLAASDDIVAELKEEYKKNENSTAKMPTLGKEGDLKLIHFRGVGYNEKAKVNGKEYTWDDLLDQLTFSDMAKLIAKGFHSTAYIKNVSKPLTNDENGPCGLSAGLTGGPAATGYPCAGIRAATFNTDLNERMGKVWGNDCLMLKKNDKSYSGLYGPGVNIQRTPYGGRNFEYYSEDAFLTGYACAAEVKGLQEKGVYVYIKHLALNDQETGRDGISVWASEQGIREIYLRAFELPIVKANAHGVMTSFNRIGATWAGAHKGLLTDVMRGEWNMDGMAITDYSANRYMDVLLGVLAGSDIWDYSGDAWEKMLKANKTDSELVNAMRDSCKRIMYTVVNSCAMNGITAETDIVEITPWWKITLVALDVTFGVLMLASAAMFVLTILKNKKATDKTA